MKIVFVSSVFLSSRSQRCLCPPRRHQRGFLSPCWCFNSCSMAPFHLVIICGLTHLSMPFLFLYIRRNNVPIFRFPQRGSECKWRQDPCKGVMLIPHNSLWEAQVVNCQTGTNVSGFILLMKRKTDWRDGFEMFLIFHSWFLHKWATLSVLVVFVTMYTKGISFAVLPTLKSYIEDIQVFVSIQLTMSCWIHWGGNDGYSDRITNMYLEMCQ